MGAARGLLGYVDEQLQIGRREIWRGERERERDG